MHLRFLNYKSKLQPGPALFVLNRLALSLYKLTSESPSALPTCLFFFSGLTNYLGMWTTFLKPHRQTLIKSLSNQTVYGQAPLIPTRESWVE